MFVQEYTGLVPVGEQSGVGVFANDAHNVKYSGEYAHATMQGAGIVEHKDGKVYSGDWKSGQMDGMGVYEGGIEHK